MKYPLILYFCELIEGIERGYWWNERLFTDSAGCRRSLRATVREHSTQRPPRPGCPNHHPSSRGWVIELLLDVIWASWCISTSVTGCITHGMALSVTEASNAAFIPTIPSRTFYSYSEWNPWGVVQLYNGTRGFFGYLRTACDFLYTKTGFCGGRGLPYIPPRLDGPWFSIRREREWREFEVDTWLAIVMSPPLYLILTATCNAFQVLLFLMMAPFPDLW